MGFRGLCGFRGVPQLSIVTSSPFSVLLVAIFHPSNQYDAVRTRRNVRYFGMEEEWEETRRAKSGKLEKRISGSLVSDP